MVGTRSLSPRPAMSETASAILTVDLAALADNWRGLAERVAPAECAAVVKADAYGIGAAPAARALSAAGCGTFFVATAEEGAEIRGVLGPGARLFAFNGVTNATSEDLVAHSVTPVLNHLGQIETWGDAARSAETTLPAALHLDTGMNRLGMPPEDVAVVRSEPAFLDGIAVELIVSHLACSDEADHPMNGQQLVEFLRLKAAAPPAPASLANSAGIYLGHEYHFDMPRPGIALYGGNPTPGAANPMAEVVRVQGRILQVREIDSPRSVGYGAEFRAAGPTRIATVALGYADGFLRSLGNHGMGSLGGVQVPIAGRVSMDLITLDVTNAPAEAAVPGALVSLIGGGVDLDELAEAAGTIPYEILTGLGRRYHRNYVNGSG